MMDDRIAPDLDPCLELSAYHERWQTSKILQPLGFTKKILSTHDTATRL